jgi:heterodisulfide reductase subunit B
MKYYTYYPACCSFGQARAYDISTRVVAKALDIELIELDDWNCCGSTPYSSIDELGSICCSARNLALAEKRGLDLVTPCSDCYLMLNKVNLFMKEYPELKSKVVEALAAGGLEYNGTVRVRHILDVFANDVSSDEIASRVKINLTGLKVAAYYGCQVVRPRPSFDDPEFPQSLERLIKSLGAEPTPFPLKTRCCGASMIIPEEDIALGLIYKLLNNAISNGADCIVTACPLCQGNLDVYQSKVSKKFKTKFNIPVLFFTQLMGVAFGIDSKALALEKSIVSTQKVLAGYLK